MWRKPTDAQPSSQGTTSPSSIKMQTEGAEPEPAAVPPVAADTSLPIPVVSTFVPGADTVPAIREVSKIVSGLKVNGEVTGNCDLYVDGEVQGKIRLPEARVTVGPTGRVQADIEASEIFIQGSVQGNLKASERTHLGPASKVTGSILTPRIGIEDGASLRGKVEMVRATGSRQSSATALAPAQDSVAVSSGTGK